MDRHTAFDEYRQRSRTLQPGEGYQFRINNYFQSQRMASEHNYFQSQRMTSELERANYANVLPLSQTEEASLSAIPPPHQHHHAHSRSQSHFYHTMGVQHARDSNNYYNVPTRSRHPSPASAAALVPHPSVHSQIPQIDSVTFMQACVELGINIDQSPSMPPSRRYTIIRDGPHLYRVKFPQERYMKCNFKDEFKGVHLTPGMRVTVLGPSNEDRSKFLVCHNDKLIEVPHQLTQAPQIGRRWH